LTTKRKYFSQVTWAPVARSSYQRRTRRISVSIIRGTTLGQCACLYAWAKLVAHLWWVENQCEKKKYFTIS